MFNPGSRMLVRSLLTLFCCSSLAFSACAEYEPQNTSTSAEASSHEDPFGDAPALRVVNLAPSLGTLDVQLERPAYEGGPELVRVLEDEEPLRFTGYTARYHVSTPDGALVLLDENGERAVETELSLEPGKAYLGLALESSGLPGLEVREISTAPRSDAEGNVTGLDGKTRISVFHGSEGLGRASLVLDGPEQLVWGDLSFGDDSFADPQTAPPGEYTLALLDGSSEPIEGVLAPSTVTLEPDTWVFVFLTSTGADGGIPQVAFLVDGPAFPRQIEDVPLPMPEQ